MSIHTPCFLRYRTVIFCLMSFECIGWSYPCDFHVAHFVCECISLEVPVTTILCIVSFFALFEKVFCCSVVLLLCSFHVLLYCTVIHHACHVAVKCVIWTLSRDDFLSERFSTCHTSRDFCHLVNVVIQPSYVLLSIDLAKKSRLLNDVIPECSKSSPMKDRKVAEWKSCNDVFNEYDVLII